MKKIFFLLMCVALIATSCATQKQTVLIPDPSPKTRGVAPPVYYDGNDKPAVPGVFLYSEEQQKTN
jgi:hypothetical protein